MRRTVVSVAVAVLALGCATQPEREASVKTEAPAAPKTESWPTDVAIHRNAKGEVECPVMEEVVASPETAQGYEDYKGTRYYFCCGLCPGKFKENPALYAKADKK